MMNPKALRLLAGLALILVLAGPAAGRAVPLDAAQSAAATRSTALFDEVWQTVADKFYDRKFRGVDWPAMREKYRPLAAAATSAAAEKAVIDRMLAELGASHTGLYQADDPAYYQLMDIFAGGLRRRLRQIFPDGEVSYPGIGIFTREEGGSLFVSGVLEGLPAYQAGIVRGDEILAANGQAFRPVGSFAGRIGQKVTLKIRRAAGQPPVDVAVTPVAIKPGQAFLAALHDSARLIRVGGVKIGYIHVWSYAGERYQGGLAEEIARGALKDADALVWDLRDGWGGAQPEYLDIFNPRGPTMLVTERGGEQQDVNVKWRRPVALLINGGTRSGKEVLAYGFKKYGLGPVIGTRSEGAVLAARAFLMQDDSLLLLAVADVAVDGERLEAVGVTPTLEVPSPLPYAGGKDPQLDAAVAALARQVGG